MSATATWTFVRHAESTANAGRVLSGHDDVPLTPRGHAQAAELATRLGGLAFDRVLGSDLQRVEQTAAPLLQNVAGQPLWLPELRERDFGTWTGRSIDEARRTLEFPDWKEAVLTWNSAPPGGESWAELARRVLTVLATLDAPGHTLVVSHGGVIRVVLGLLDGESKAKIPLRRVSNTESVVRELPMGTWVRLLKTCQGHLRDAHR